MRVSLADTSWFDAIRAASSCRAWSDIVCDCDITCTACQDKKQSSHDSLKLSPVRPLPYACNKLSPHEPLAPL
jgi:hypothetical protein